MVSCVDFKKVFSKENNEEKLALVDLNNDQLISLEDNIFEDYSNNQDGLEDNFNDIYKSSLYFSVELSGLNTFIQGGGLICSLKDNLIQDYAILKDNYLIDSFKNNNEKKILYYEFYCPNSCKDTLFGYSVYCNNSKSLDILDNYGNLNADSSSYKENFCEFSTTSERTVSMLFDISNKKIHYFLDKIFKKSINIKSNCIKSDCSVFPTIILKSKAKVVLNPNGSFLPYPYCTYNKLNYNLLNNNSFNDFLFLCFNNKIYNSIDNKFDFLQELLKETKTNILYNNKSLVNYSSDLEVNIFKYDSNICFAISINSKDTIIVENSNKKFIINVDENNDNLLYLTGNNLNNVINLAFDISNIFQNNITSANSLSLEDNKQLQNKHKIVEDILLKNIVISEKISNEFINIVKEELNTFKTDKAIDKKYLNNVIFKVECIKYCLENNNTFKNIIDKNNKLINKTDLIKKLNEFYETNKACKNKNYKNNASSYNTFFNYIKNSNHIVVQKNNYLHSFYYDMCNNNNNVMVANSNCNTNFINLFTDLLAIKELFKTINLEDIIFNCFDVKLLNSINLFLDSLDDSIIYNNSENNSFYTIKNTNKNELNYLLDFVLRKLNILTFINKAKTNNINYLCSTDRNEEIINNFLINLLNASKTNKLTNDLSDNFNTKYLNNFNYLPFSTEENNTESNIIKQDSITINSPETEKSIINHLKYTFGNKIKTSLVETMLHSCFIKENYNKSYFLNNAYLTAINILNQTKYIRLGNFFVESLYRSFTNSHIIDNKSIIELTNKGYFINNSLNNEITFNKVDNSNQIFSFNLFNKIMSKNKFNRTNSFNLSYSYKINNTNTSSNISSSNKNLFIYTQEESNLVSLFDTSIVLSNLITLNIRESVNNLEDLSLLNCIFLTRKTKQSKLLSKISEIILDKDCNTDDINIDNEIDIPITNIYNLFCNINNNNNIVLNEALVDSKYIYDVEDIENKNLYDTSNIKKIYPIKKKKKKIGIPINLSNQINKKLLNKTKIVNISKNQLNIASKLNTLSSKQEYVLKNSLPLLKDDIFFDNSNTYNNKKIKYDYKTLSNNKTNNKSVVEPLQDLVNNLYLMGFPINACKHFLIENNNNFDKALDSLLEKSSDTEFMKQFEVAEAEKIQDEIPSWQCNECTFYNESGSLNCKMCLGPPSSAILDKFMSLKNQREALEKENQLKDITDKINDKTNKIENNLLQHLKNMCLYDNCIDTFPKNKYIIKKVHLYYNLDYINNNYSSSINNDSLCPFILISILHDVINSKLLYNSYKLMINPRILNEFISNECSKSSDNLLEKWICLIDNSMFSSLEDCINYILLNYSHIILNIYPKYILPNIKEDIDMSIDIGISSPIKTNKDRILEAIKLLNLKDSDAKVNNILSEHASDFYNDFTNFSTSVLIPVEFNSFVLKDVNAYYDSVISNTNLITLIENTNGTKSLVNFQINNYSKYSFDIYNPEISSVSIEFTCANLYSNETINLVNEDISSTAFKTIEFDINDYNIKLFHNNKKDSKSVYIINKNKIMEVNTLDSSIILNKYDLSSNISNIIKIECSKVFIYIYDEVNSIYKLNINENKISENNMIDSDIKGSYINSINLENIDYLKISEHDLNYISDIIKYKKIRIIPNDSNYFKIDLPAKDIKFKLSNFNSNQLLKFRVKFIIKSISNIKNFINNKEDFECEDKINNSKLINSESVTKSLSSKQLIPLKVVKLIGASNNYNSNPSNILLNNSSKFVSNYSQPCFILNHINDKYFKIDDIIVSSDTQNSILDNPFGYGLVFLTDTYQTAINCYNYYRNLTKEIVFNNEGNDFSKLFNFFKYNQLGLKLSPCAVIDMKDFKWRIVKLSTSNNIGKYIVILPLSTRTIENINSLKEFCEKALSFNFIGVKGEELEKKSTRKKENNNNNNKYLDSNYISAAISIHSNNNVIFNNKNVNISLYEITSDPTFGFVDNVNCLKGEVEIEVKLPIEYAYKNNINDIELNFDVCLNNNEFKNSSSYVYFDLYKYSDDSKFRDLSIFKNIHPEFLRKTLSENELQNILFKAIINNINNSTSINYKIINQINYLNNAISSIPLVKKYIIEILNFKSFISNYILKEYNSNHAYFCYQFLEKLIESSDNTKLFIALKEILSNIYNDLKYVSSVGINILFDLIGLIDIKDKQTLNVLMNLLINTLKNLNNINNNTAYNIYLKHKILQTITDKQISESYCPFDNNIYYLKNKDGLDINCKNKVIDNVQISCNNLYIEEILINTLENNQLSYKFNLNHVCKINLINISLSEFNIKYPFKVKVYVVPCIENNNCISLNNNNNKLKDNLIEYNDVNDLNTSSLININKKLIYHQFFDRSYAELLRNYNIANCQFKNFDPSININLEDSKVDCLTNLIIVDIEIDMWSPYENTDSDITLSKYIECIKEKDNAEYPLINLRLTEYEVKENMLNINKYSNLNKIFSEYINKCSFNKKLSTRYINGILYNTVYNEGIESSCYYFKCEDKNLINELNTSDNTYTAIKNIKELILEDDLNIQNNRLLLNNCLKEYSIKNESLNTNQIDNVINVLEEIKKNQVNKHKHYSNLNNYLKIANSSNPDISTYYENNLFHLSSTESALIILINNIYSVLNINVDKELHLVLNNNLEFNNSNEIIYFLICSSIKICNENLTNNTINFINKFLIRSLSNNNLKILFDKINNEFLTTKKSVISSITACKCIGKLSIDISVICCKISNIINDFKNKKNCESDYFVFFNNICNLFVLFDIKTNELIKVNVSDIKYNEIGLALSCIFETIDYITYNNNLPINANNSLIELSFNLLIKYLESDMYTFYLESISDIKKENENEYNICSIDKSKELIEFIIKNISSKKLYFDKLKPKLNKALDNLIDPYHIESINIKSSNDNNIKLKDSRIVAALNIVTNTTLIVQNNLIDNLNICKSMLNNHYDNVDYSYLKILDFNIKLLAKIYNISSNITNVCNDSNIKLNDSSLINKYNLKNSNKFNQIQKNNSDIILMFTDTIVLLKHDKLSSISYINDIFNNLVCLAEKSTIYVLIKDNCLLNLIKSIYSSFSANIIEILYPKLIKLIQLMLVKHLCNNNISSIEKMTILYTEDDTLKNFSNELILILEYLIFNNANKETEKIAFTFSSYLIEIYLGELTYNHELQNQSIVNTNTTVINYKNMVGFNPSFEYSFKLFELLSVYLVKYFNLSSFTGVISSNKIYIVRAELYQNLTNLVDKVSLNILNEALTKDDYKQKLSYSIFNYCIWCIFNKYEQIPNQPLVIGYISKNYSKTMSIIDNCCNNKTTIEILLVQLMKIVKKLDRAVFNNIYKDSICLKKAIIIFDKLFTNLESILNKCLVNDEITKLFAFKLEGFKYFIGRVNAHRSEKNLFISQNNLIEITQNNQIYSNYISIDNHTIDYINLINLNYNGSDSNYTIKSSSPVKLNDNNYLTTTNKHDKSSYYDGKLDNYKYEEFCTINKFFLLEGSDIKYPSNTIGSVDWSAKKKGLSNNCYLRHMKDNSTEEVFYFKSLSVVELKDIQIGFNFNITNIVNKGSGLVESVYLEAGEYADNLNICIKLNRIEDTTYLEKGVIAYGFNFFSFSPDNINVNSDNMDNYLNDVINNLINCRAKFFKFTVKKPILSSNENTHNSKFSENKNVIAISFVSMMGVKLVETEAALSFIQDIEKDISIKIISKLFTSEFIETLKSFAENSDIIENIKQIYNAFEPNLINHIDILPNIFINTSKFSYELGEWLLSKLLNIENSNIHAKLAIEIVQNNKECLDLRVNRYLGFVLENLNNIQISIKKNNISEDKLNKQLESISNYVSYFNIVYNKISISPFFRNKINITIDGNILTNIIDNINTYTSINNIVINFISLLLLQNNKVNIIIKEININDKNNNVITSLTVENIINILQNKYKKTYIYDYAIILSILIANNKEYSIKAKSSTDNIHKYYCKQFINQVKRNIKGKNMYYLMKIIKNMSYSLDFISIVKEKGYAFEIFKIIKNNDDSSSSMLICDNSDFLNDFVIFFKNCINYDSNSYKRVAAILINDLEICKKKVDEVYSNKILMPLLRMEETINICLHPIDSTYKYLSSMQINQTFKFSDSKENLLFNSNINNFSKQCYSSNEDSNYIEKVLKKNCKIMSKTAIENFVKQYNECTLQDNTNPKFDVKHFNLVFSTKEFKTKNNLTSNSSLSLEMKSKFFITVGEAISEKKNVMFVVNGNNTQTIFYCEEKVPVLPKVLNSDHMSSGTIPFTKRNIMYQCNNNGYIYGNIFSDLDSYNNEEYDMCNIYYDKTGANISIVQDFINLNIYDMDNSMVNPYYEVVNVTKSKGIETFLICDVEDWEIYVGYKNNDKVSNVNSNLDNTTKIIDKKISQLFDFSYDSDLPSVNLSNVYKINSTKLLDEYGNYDVLKVKDCKYFTENNPLFVNKPNPVFEFPSNTSVKALADFTSNKNLDIRILDIEKYCAKKFDKINITLSEALSTINQINIEEDIDDSYLINSNNNINRNNTLLTNNINNNLSKINCLDLCYDISQLRQLNPESEEPLKSFLNYEPNLPVFNAFQNLEGMKTIINTITSSIEKWNSNSAKEYWLEWVKMTKAFSIIPGYLTILMNHHKCFDILFNILCGLYDDNSSVKIYGLDAERYIYEILNTLFNNSESKEIRSCVVKCGVFDAILEKLSKLTREKPRKRCNLKSSEDIEEVIIENKKKVTILEPNKKPTKKGVIKGVGYGSDHTGDNNQWDINNYIENKKTRSDQISLFVTLLANFFKSNEFNIDDNFISNILESIILPCIESALRGGTLLEMSKEEKIYYSYLDLISQFSNNKSLIPLLMNIGTEYKPVQTESIYQLLASLNNVAKIFLNAITNKASTPSIEEKLANEIQKTYDLVSNKIDSYKNLYSSVKDYESILKLPISKSYPILLKDLSFGYMNMRNNDNKLLHLYANSISKEISQSKLVRLAQEYADLSRSLPIEDTNSIFVRVDENNMDYMKVLIMGSTGTPYAHGAFEYDVYFDSQYPSGPPKVTLVTTGSGQVRFNPNLYANGKVCLSLLGTWRGNSTENWNPKISTLLQVLISIQSIIMSSLVYFNEPSCESQMGTPEGEAKNEAYSNIVRYCNVKYAIIEQILNPSKGFEDVIKRHFYLKKKDILDQIEEWIERSTKTEAKYLSFSYDHNVTWAQKFSKAKQYTSNLKSIYDEAKSVLDDLPLPNDLKKKEEESLKKKTNIKKEGAKFIDLDNIDVAYNDKEEDVNVYKEDKEINVDDDAVKDRWSRYIGAMGIDAVKKQSAASIFLSGLSPLGVEIAKNIILSGCKDITLHDTKITNAGDLSGQFFLGQDDIGKNRAEACLRKLKDLNNYVKVNTNINELPTNKEDIEKLFNGYNTVILSDIDNEKAIKINSVCRAKKIKFILCDIYGVFGRIINDFGDEFVVHDTNGEESEEVILSNISNDEKGTIVVLKGTKHPFSDGDYILISEVEGMQLKDKDANKAKINYFNTKSDNFDNKDLSINNSIHKVKVINSTTFKIGDLSMFENYIRNGKCKQIKMEKKLKFDSLSSVLNNFDGKYLDENLSIADFSKMCHNTITHLGYYSINQFILNKGRKPYVMNINDCLLLLDICNKKAEELKYKLEDSDIKLIYYLSLTNRVQFSPLAAFYGGFVAQEVIKAITGKFTPTNQIFYYNSYEVLPEINFESILDINKLSNLLSSNTSEYSDKLKQIDNELNKIYSNRDKINKYINNLNESDKTLTDDSNNKFTRSLGLRCILGDKTLEQLMNVNTLVVGAGAIGCELLKNFSMLEVGTGNGRIIVTDPDIIEVSNLNRQFLFREKHLRMQKSSTAAAAICQMNSNIKGHVFAQIDKVCDDTEHIFTDKLFSELTLVANALDNVKARRYVDSRCVSNRIPLLESGTLGPKGHVQVIIPFKTESYSSQSDPEVTNDIPQCTLKMFPEEAIHCIEWAKEIFGKLFSLRPKNMNKAVEEGPENQDIKTLKQVIKTLKDYPETFDDCIKLARESFQKYFCNDQKHLIEAYPIDKKNKDGSFFWTLPKRPPVWLDYNNKDIVHTQFISSFACLTAKLFNIKIPYTNPRSKEIRDKIGCIASQFKTKEYVVDINKLNQMKKEVEKDEQNKNNKDDDKKSKDDDKNSKDEEIINDEKQIDLLVKEFNEIIKCKFTNKNNKSFNVEEFEKDNDQNFHIDVIHSMGSLRCRNYKIEEMDWITVKLKAGRIIPALATTTASIAGLQALELVKIVQKQEFDKIRNSFLNFAIPIMQSSEPGEISKTILRKDPDVSVTLWDRWEIEFDSNEKPTLSNVYNFIIKNYSLYPKDCFAGKKCVYSYIAFKDNEAERQKILNNDLRNLVDFINDVYVDLTITLTLEKEDVTLLKNVPVVRVIMK